MGVKQTLTILMQKNNMNASQLADAAGLAKSTVYALLKRDSSNISYQTAQKLARALNCSESDILDLDIDTASRYEDLQASIKDLTDEISKLDSCEEVVRYTAYDEEGNEITITEPLHEEYKAQLEGMLSTLSREIKYLMERSGVSMKPSIFPEIVNYYKELNELGRLEAVKRVEELTQIPKYTK